MPCENLCLAWLPVCLHLPCSRLQEQVCPFPCSSHPLLSFSATILFFLLFILSSWAEEAAGEGFARRGQQPPQPGWEPIHRAGFSRLSRGLTRTCPRFPLHPVSRQTSLLQSACNQGDGSTDPLHSASRSREQGLTGLHCSIQSIPLPETVFSRKKDKKPVKKTGITSRERKRRSKGTQPGVTGPDLKCLKPAAGKRQKLP